jgi:hypothetical protein
MVVTRGWGKQGKERDEERLSKENNLQLNRNKKF